MGNIDYERMWRDEHIKVHRLKAGLAEAKGIIIGLGAVIPEVLKLSKVEIWLETHKEVEAS